MGTTHVRAHLLGSYLMDHDFSSNGNVAESLTLFNVAGLRAEILGQGTDRAVDGDVGKGWQWKAQVSPQRPLSSVSWLDLHPFQTCG
jgi:hypothetical protein